MKTIYNLETKLGELHIFNCIKKTLTNYQKNQTKKIYCHNKIKNCQEITNHEFKKIICDNYQLIQPDNNSKDSDILLIKENQKIAIEITRALNKPFLEIAHNKNQERKNVKQHSGNFYYQIKKNLQKEFINSQDLASLWTINVIDQIIYQTKEKITKAWSNHYNKHDKNILIIAFDWPQELIINHKMQSYLFHALKTLYNIVLADLIKNNNAFFEYFIFAGFHNLQLHQMLIYD